MRTIVATIDELTVLTRKLNAGQIDLLIEMANAMTVPIGQKIHPNTDIVNTEFAANFSNRLLMHHAVNLEKFKKKSFEYAFAAASRSAGRSAKITASSTNPGEDVSVNGVAFSLKTEASANLNRDKITISKLMEARWIRECQSTADFARETTSRVVKHLQKYQRILTLRAFDLPGARVQYDLVEIPLRVLLLVGKLTAADFTPRTTNGSSKADVKDGSRKAYTLRLDGSVEKVTVSDLAVSLCTIHASWIILVSQQEQDE